MPRVEMGTEHRPEVEAAQRQSKNVHHWERSQAAPLRADGMPSVVVAQTPGCGEASVTNSTTTWREQCVAGIPEGEHPGAARRYDAATGWTVAPPRHERTTRGWRASARSTLVKISGG